MTTAPVYGWNQARFSGVHGVGVNQNWTPFDFTTYGYTTMTKFIIGFNCVAVASNEAPSAGPRYAQDYVGKAVYLWDPVGLTGSVVKTNLEMNDPGDFAWAISNSGLSGNMVINFNGNPSNTWTVALTAKIYSAAIL